MQVLKQRCCSVVAMAGLLVLAALAPVATGQAPVRWDVAFSKDGALLGTCGDRVRIYDVKTAELLREIEGRPTRCIAFSAVDPGQFAAADKDGILRLWRLSEGGLYREFKGHTDSIESVAYERTGRYVASTSAWGDYDDPNRGQLRLWDIETGRLARSLDVTSGKIWGVSFSDDGSLIAFCRVDQGKACYTECYEVDTWQRLASIRISAGRELEVNQWGESVPTGYVTRFTPNKAHILVGGGICVRTNPQGYNYACRPTQVLWRVALADSSSTRLLVDGDRHACFSIAVSPDGQYLASGNGPVDLRRISDGSLLWSNDYGRGVAVSPDGGLVAAVHDDSVVLLNAKTGAVIRSLPESN